MLNRPTKHPLNASISFAELAVLIDLASPTVTRFDGQRFEVAFDSATELHTASLILAGLRQYSRSWMISREG